MKTPEKEAVTKFLNHFYDICSTIECKNYTLDEFYDDFPTEMHEFITEFIKNSNLELKNG